jgi:hypothetical protein
MKLFKKKCPNCKGIGHIDVEHFGGNPDFPCVLCKGSGIRNTLLGALLIDSKNIVGDCFIGLGKKLKGSK